MIRRSTLFFLVVVVGCTVAPNLLTLPTGLTQVLGGISDQRPYFGTFRNSAGQVEGEFLLATCGCGDWRVLLTKADGSQWQFPIHFYTAGEYQPTGDVTVFGEEGGEVLLGTVNQDSGAADGATNHGTSPFNFLAQRGENHTDDATACVKCHIGADPIWPQPPTHPPRCDGATSGCYTVDPPNCLSCHTVVITE